MSPFTPSSVGREDITTQTTMESPFTPSSVFGKDITTHTTVESDFFNHTHIQKNEVIWGKIYKHTLAYNR